MTRELSVEVSYSFASGGANTLQPANTNTPLAARNRFLLISAGHVGVISAGNNISLTSLTGTSRLMDNLNTTVTQATSIAASGNLSLVAGGALTLKGASVITDHHALGR